jgi:Transposase IS4
MDPSSNWWSNNILLESTTTKQIMSGRRFQTILSYLHECDLAKQPNKTDPDYDLAYKVNQLQQLLESLYKRLLIPGQYLSLDKTLIRAFGRIKFKVHIITKSARYSIKLYVVMDAVTAFLLKVIIYTGKQTYLQQDEDLMKTFQIVKNIVRHMPGHIEQYLLTNSILQATS